MRKLTLAFTFFLLVIAVPQLRAQTDTVPPIGGIVLDEDTYATLGDPEQVTRSSAPGSKKSLLEKTSILPLNQRCELSCGSCTVSAAVSIRRKIYCAPRCKCNLEEVFSWSYLHNQLVKAYGKNNIRLKNILDLFQEQGIPLAKDFPNMGCSHDRLPEKEHRDHAAQYKYWIYQPIFKAKKNISGSPEQKEALFREQLVAKTIAWIDYNIPVIIGLMVTEDFRILTSQNCLWKAPNPLTGAAGHAMLVIGYDDDAEEFEVLNSYGAAWGCGGLLRIGYADYTRVVQEGYVIKFDFETGKKVDCPPRR